MYQHTHSGRSHLIRFVNVLLVEENVIGETVHKRIEDTNHKQRDNQRPFPLKVQMEKQVGNVFWEYSCISFKQIIFKQTNQRTLPYV